MQTTIFFYFLLAAIISLGLVWYQYYYRTKRKGKLNLALAFFRFLTFFCGFLLLFNPRFTKNVFTTEKANLIILADNSSSMATYRDDIRNVLGKVKENNPLNDRFVISNYTFGSSLKNSDSISLDENTTDLTKALRGLGEIYSSTNSTVVLLSDGNQTRGEDYGFYSKNQKLPVYAVAIGDTTQYEDLAINQINANRYAFLKNKYPVEIFVSYAGNKSVNSNINISVNGKVVFKQNVKLSKTDNTKTISTLLDAKSVGLKNISVSVEGLVDERNTNNNNRQVVVEVIDEKTNIAIVSNMLHPDLGTLKKAITRNEQRAVRMLKPSSSSKEWEDMDLFVLYQPDPTFKKIYDYIQQKKASIFTVTGPSTDWNFLNQVQQTFSKNSYNQTDEVFPVLNQGFGLFNITDFSIIDFPPLESNLGEVILHKSGEVLLNQKIRGALLNEPLLALIRGEGQKEAILFGENSWKWRIQTYKNEKSFKNFDDLIGKIILYLATNKGRERLALNYETVFSGSNEVKISATYFDETFVFDPSASISIITKNIDSKKVGETPLLLKGNYFEADLGNLPPGKYEFTVRVKNENLTKSGSFTILDFDIEKQFLTTDYQKMTLLAQKSGGKPFYPSEINDLLLELSEDDRFTPIQKSKQNVVSLVDFRMLLAVMTIALALEWFIRKYNGLI